MSVLTAAFAPSRAIEIALPSRRASPGLTAASDDGIRNPATSWARIHLPMKRGRSSMDTPRVALAAVVNASEIDATALDGMIRCTIGGRSRQRRGSWRWCVHVVIPYGIFQDGCRQEDYTGRRSRCRAAYRCRIDW